MKAKGTPKARPAKSVPTARGGDGAQNGFQVDCGVNFR
jgi:hypothetical protein